MKEKKCYEKPKIIKEIKMQFPTKIIETKGVVCKGCSSCHGCK